MSSRTNALTPAFTEESIGIRGVKYTFQELSIGEYDDLVKKATITQTNALTGEEEERIDNTVLLRMMVCKCSVSPKLTPESLSAMPMRAVLKINQTVNRMHYGDEPTESKAEDGGEEEESKGND